MCLSASPPAIIHPTHLCGAVSPAAGATTEALAASEGRLCDLLEAAVHAIICIDERGTIGLVNPAAERMFGYSARELIGQNVGLLMPSLYREEHDQYIGRYLAAGPKRIIGISRAKWSTGARTAPPSLGTCLWLKPGGDRRGCMAALDLSPSFHELVFETAAEHLSTRVPVVSPTATAEEVRRSLAGRRFDTVAEIAVCQDGRLKGLLSIEELLAAPPEAVVAQLMDADPPTVAPGLDQEKAAWKAVQHGEVSLAVVDEQGRFLGLIPPQRLLQVLLWEHDEDMARLGGVLHSTSMARSATEEPIARRLGHRLPWLLLGLAGALLAADLVGLFQGLLEKNVVLAFFLPGVVYLADAVGTQTETLVIRGLSVGVPLGRVVRRELLTGLFIGAALGLLFFPFALWRWSNFDVAVAVGLALLAACSTASLAAMALPWLLQRLGTDPAFGSGPLATVVQDLLSIGIYLVICRAIVP